MRILLLPALILLLSSCADDKPASSGTAPAAAPVDKGQALFRQHCSTCHNPLKDLTGPALKGALARWDHDTVRIREFIRNPAKAIAAGDPRAVAAFEAYKPTVMTAFPQLANEEIDLIIAYFESAR